MRAFFVSKIKEIGTDAQSNPSLTNAFGYWQGQTIGNASATFIDDIMQAFGRVQTLAGVNAPELWVGETGWPTDGT